MTFSDEQMRQLSVKLSPKNIKTRESNGTALAYIEGWHAVSEANRIYQLQNPDPVVPPG